jgi:hydroxymethylglutaryl-CoA lyase
MAAKALDHRQFCMQSDRDAEGKRKMTGPIEIVEVSPRDGLQNEATALATEDKVSLVERALAAGLRRVEVTSFVNPARVPRMADAEAVLAALRGRPGLRRIGLVLNRRGLDRAVAAGVDEVNFVIVASDTFNRRNQGVATEETMQVWRAVAADARAAGLGVSAVLAAAFGCPFEGEVPVRRVADLVRAIAESGPDEIALADTIGVASPADVIARFSAAAEAAPGIRLRGHFHNTRNTGLANAYAAIGCGVTVLDASLGGIGGCPFAPAATGNIPTEDLAYMLSRMGRLGDVDLPALVDSALWLQERLGHPVPGMLGRAGLFPKSAAAA